MNMQHRARAVADTSPACSHQGQSEGEAEGAEAEGAEEAVRPRCECAMGSRWASARTEDQ
jgi:hypothetical protein